MRSCVFIFFILFVSIGCEEIFVSGTDDRLLDIELQDGEYYKSIELDVVTDSIDTKSEGLTVNKASYYIYRSVNGGDFELLSTLHLGNQTAYINLVFSSQTTYTYEIRLYFNLPTSPTEEPALSSILLENDNPAAFMMHGSSGVVSSSSSVVPIKMNRFANKIVLNTVRLNLPYEYESTVFKLKRFYLAGVYGDVAGSTILNSDGKLNSTLYVSSTPNVTISHNAKVTISGPLYFYGPSANLVLECTYGSSTYYYVKKLTGFTENQSRTVNYEIFALGSSSPTIS